MEQWTGVRRHQPVEIAVAADEGTGGDRTAEAAIPRTRTVSVVNKALLYHVPVLHRTEIAGERVRNWRRQRFSVIVVSTHSRHCGRNSSNSWQKKSRMRGGHDAGARG